MNDNTNILYFAARVRRPPNVRRAGSRIDPEDNAEQDMPDIDISIIPEPPPPYQYNNTLADTPVFYIPDGNCNLPHDESIMTVPSYTPYPDVAPPSYTEYDETPTDTHC